MATKPQQDDPVVESVRNFAAQRLGVSVDQVEVWYRAPLPDGLFGYLCMGPDDRRDWLTSRD